MHCANEVSYVPLLLRYIRNLLQPCIQLTITIVLEALHPALRLRDSKAIENLDTVLPPSSIV